MDFRYWEWYIPQPAIPLNLTSEMHKMTTLGKEKRRWRFESSPNTESKYSSNSQTGKCLGILWSECNWSRARNHSCLSTVILKVLSSWTAMTWHVQNNQGIRHRQHGFRKCRSCRTNVIFDDHITCLMRERLLSAWISVKPLTPSPSEFSQRNWQPISCTGVLWLGWKMAGWLGPESGGEWSYIELSFGHKRYSWGLSTGAKWSSAFSEVCRGQQVVWEFWFAEG